jgi:MFS family permease
MLASALVTFDGTAVTLALPAIRRALEVPPSSLHWISDAPLLLLAVMLLPAGSLADRHGHFRTLRHGLLIFAASAALAASAASTAVLMTARAAQGIGAAFILPSAFAVIRAAIDNPHRQARKFGVLAAWTGAAAVAGPLLGGVLADVLTWRAVFALTAATAFASYIALWRARDVRRTAAASMFPVELIRRRNCVAANVATFGLYVGVFGLPFVIALYLQDVLDYSALTTSLAILPLSTMMFFSAPFAKWGAQLGSRRLIAIGSVIAAAGAGWMAAFPASVPIWTTVVLGNSLFGLGVSIAVSPLTQAAIAGVDKSCAGSASALNHAVVRAAGLVGIALLGSIAGSHASDGFTLEGFRSAMSMCGAIGATCGVGGALLLRDEEAGVL